MARFLIAFVRNRSSEYNFSKEIFEVSYDCTAHDVLVPKNTIFFIFATADVYSTEEFINSFELMDFYNTKIPYTSIPLNIENNGKRYWIGKIITINNIPVIYNEYAGGLIPFFCLRENDELIDL